MFVCQKNAPPLSLASAGNIPNEAPGKTFYHRPLIVVLPPSDVQLLKELAMIPSCTLDQVQAEERKLDTGSCSSAPFLGAWDGPINPAACLKDHGIMC